MCLCHMKDLFCVFRETSILLSIMTGLIYIPTGSSLCLLSAQYLLFAFFFFWWGEVRWALYSLARISVMAAEGECAFVWIGVSAPLLCVVCS